MPDVTIRTALGAERGAAAYFDHVCVFSASHQMQGAKDYFKQLVIVTRHQYLTVNGREFGISKISASSVECRRLFICLFNSTPAKSKLYRCKCTVHLLQIQSS